MPKLTPEYDRVTVIGNREGYAGPICELIMYRSVVMSHEVKMCEDYYNKEILILDLKNVTTDHLVFGLPGLKKIFFCGQVR